MNASDKLSFDEELEAEQLRQGPFKETMMSKGRAIRLVDYRAALSCVGSANERQRLRTYRVLADVYQLLEEYAPVWYSSRIRMRLRSALQAMAEPACEN